MNKIVKNALILMAITLVAGILLGAVYEITKGPIAKQEEQAKMDAYKEVFQDADTFEEIPENVLSGDDMRKVLDENDLAACTVKEVLKALDAGGNTIGVVMNITDSEGYGGDINFSMGIQNDGTVNGIAILTISETAGLGMKADTDEFKSQFAGKKVDKFQYTKTGAESEDQIDAISGATITTNAVTNGVNAGICLFKSIEEGGILGE